MVEIAETAVHKAVEREISVLADALNTTTDIVLPLLKFHLFAEHILERIICERLPRADRFLDQRVNFAQKLALVSSFDTIKDASVQAMRQVNALRNECSHVRCKQISQEDVDRIGQSLGSDYRKIKHRHGHDLRLLLIFTLAKIAVSFITVLITPEVQDEIREMSKGKADCLDVESKNE
jgi:hypothetical protein